jgi:hypothetical protein
MNSELDVLMASLKGEFGLTLAFTSWVTVLRIVFSFFNTKLKEFAEQALPAEQAGIQRLLNSLPWRVLVFVVNVLCSVKLPTTAKGVNQPMP